MSSTLAARFPTALVTGASSGLGEAFAEMLLNEGVKVWGTSRTLERLGGLKSRFSGFVPTVLDLTDPSGLETNFNQAADQAGGAFDLLVNNAGFGVYGRFDDTQFQEWERQLAGMLTSTLRVTHLALARIRARQPLRGTIVNISSLAAEFPLPYMSGYNVAKAGLSAFSESLMFESQRTGLTVIDFRPGDYRTSFNNVMSNPHAGGSPALDAVFRVLDAKMQASPEPSKAAQDLRRALLKGRSSVVRSGSLFQARIGPLLARVITDSMRRRILAGYFGAR